MSGKGQGRLKLSGIGNECKPLATGQITSPSPAVGARVRCEGLVDAAELNGCLGRVVGHDGARARVLMDGGRDVRVKPRNLVVVFELLDRLLELPGLFEREVLARLSSTDIAVLSQLGPRWLAAVVGSGLPHAGKSEGVPLKLNEFVGSAGRLAWARENGCPWTPRACAVVAKGGNLQAG